MDVYGITSWQYEEIKKTGQGSMFEMSCPDNTGCKKGGMIRQSLIEVLTADRINVYAALGSYGICMFFVN